MNNILFYGPVGNKKGTIIGGGESGNKRTIKILSKLGFNVIVLNKPYPVQIPLLKSFIYLFQLTKTYLKFVWKLLTLKIHSFHLSAFYFHLVYIEYLFIVTCKVFKLKSVYEIRAGGAESAYQNRSYFYRFIFKQTVKNATVVLCQGKEAVTFIKLITGKTALYYPNYITEDQYASYQLNNREKASKPNLVYFGRVVPAKNITFIIDVCDKLKQVGFDFNIEIIGSLKGNDEYVNRLKSMIDHFNIADEVSMPGPIKTDNLFALLLNKHFFIFPTIEDREGHSNSLTEAMSRGVVPIVSNIGFNKSIVNDEDLVIDIFDPQLYADKIISIWQSGKWSTLSKRNYDIIDTLFTEAGAKITLFEAHA